MNNTEQFFPQNLQIQSILDKHLNSRASAVNSQISQNSHLDEDFLSAFIEGNLTKLESNTGLNHLVECSFCRHVTAELIKLDYAFAGDTENSHAVETNEPSKISEVLSGLLSRLFGSNDAAVFAHEEQKEDTIIKKEEKKNIEPGKE